MRMNIKNYSHIYTADYKLIKNKSQISYLGE